MASVRTQRDYKYLLGDAAREAARLRAQARLWDPVSLALFDRLKIRPGWRVLEIGPGQGSLHLELRRRVKKPVDAVERSTPFATRLARIVRRDGFGDGQIWNMDLLEAPLPEATYDLIFARWVFLFLPDPLAHLKKLARALKPGGRVAIQDYHRSTFRIVPPLPHWSDFVAADDAFFATQGGNASIGDDLLSILGPAGLDFDAVDSTTMTGHPGSPVWNWVTVYCESVMDRYARLPPFSPGKAATLWRAWQKAGERPGTLLVAPTVLDVVGRRPSHRR